MCNLDSAQKWEFLWGINQTLAISSYFEKMRFSVPLFPFISKKNRLKKLVRPLPYRIQNSLLQAALVSLESKQLQERGPW